MEENNCDYWENLLGAKPPLPFFMSSRWRVSFSPPLFLDLFLNIHPPTLRYHTKKHRKCFIYSLTYSCQENWAHLCSSDFDSEGVQWWTVRLHIQETFGLVFKARRKGSRDEFFKETVSRIVLDNILLRVLFSPQKLNVYMNKSIIKYWKWTI